MQFLEDVLQPPEFFCPGD